MAKGNGNIPRYHAPNFKPIHTPDSPGLIKGYDGGKLMNGVIRYPEGVKINPVRAAKAQALMDYNNNPTPQPRQDMAEIYGDDYLKEFERLKTAKRGPSAERKGV